MSKPNKKILITGGHGMVGSYFSSEKECILLGKEELDVTKKVQIKKAIEKYNPKAIVHLAALTDVDYAQEHPEKAFQVNALGTHNMASMAKKHDIHLVYVSTGAVFYGQAKKPYKTSSSPNPRSIYAKSKRMGEEFIEAVCDKYSIVRTGWIFGGFEKDKKFVAAIAKQIWGGNKEIMAVTDAFGCPTYGKDLVDTILKIIANQQYGLFHAVNKGFASRYQIAKLIAKELSEKVKVSKASTDDFPGFIAPRPKFEVVEQSLSMRTWQSSLKEYLFEWQESLVQKYDQKKKPSFSSLPSPSLDLSR